MSTTVPSFACLSLFSYGYSQHTRFDLVKTRGCKVNLSNKAHAGKTFVIIIHLAERRVIAKADVAAVLPGTVGICSQKHLFHGHRSNSQNSDILCQHHPPHSIMLKRIFKYVLKHTRIEASQRVLYKTSC